MPIDRWSNEEKIKILNRMERRNEVKERKILESEKISIFHMYCKLMCVLSENALNVRQNTTVKSLSYHY